MKNYEKLPGAGILKITANVIVDLFLSLLFLIVGVALISIGHTFVTTAALWLVLLCAAVISIGLAVLMAHIFDR